MSHDGEVATHVARLQTRFSELNDTFRKLGESCLSDRVLIARILSTLAPEFRNVWESMSPSNRTLLYEKLRTIEQRELAESKTALRCEPVVVDPEAKS